MLIDFLCTLRPILKDEFSDFESLLNELNSESSFTAFMPIIYPDFSAAVSLLTTPAARYTKSGSIPKVFLCPIGAHDFFIKPTITRMIREFYTDEAPETWGDEVFSYLLKKGDGGDGESDRFDITEMMLLDLPTLRQGNTGRPLRISPVVEPNVVYIRLVPTGANPIHLFLISDTPESTWRTCVEGFDIKTDMLIHHHNGIGDWYTSTPLYEVMRKRAKPACLPKYYFRGKFISTDDSPEGSLLEESFVGIDNTEFHIYKLPEKL